MALGSDDLVLHLIAKTGEFSGPLNAAKGHVDKFGASFKEAGDKGGSSLKDLASNFVGSGGLTAVAGIAAGAIVSFGASAVHAAIEGQQAHARLDVAIKNVGGTTEQYGGKIENVVGKMARFGFTNDEVESSLARLIPVTHNVNTAINLQSTAADIAAATGKDLATSTQDIASALEGKTKALAKDVGANKEEAKSLNTVNGITAAVSAKLGGSAAAAAGTFEGKMKALSAETQNFKEKIGNEALPALTGFVSGMEATVSGGEHLVSGLTSATSHFGLLGKVAKDTVLHFATFGASDIVGGLTKLGEHTDKVKESSDKLSKAEKQLAEDTAKSGTSAEKLAADRKAVADAAGKEKTITDAVSGAVTAGTKADTTAADAKKKLADATKALLDRSKALWDAETAQLGGELALAQADHAVGTAVDDLNTKYKAAHDAKGKDKQANEDLSASNFSLQGAVQSAMNAAGEAAADTETWRQKTHGLNDQLAVETQRHKAQVGELLILEQRYPALKGIIDGYIATLGGIPKSVNTSVTINGRPAPVNSGGDLYSPTHHGSNGIGRRAAGGPVGAHTPYVVGERGPELFVPDAGGRIVPNGTAIGRGPVSLTLNFGDVNISSTTGNERDIMSQFIESVRRNGARELKQALGM